MESTTPIAAAPTVAIAESVELEGKLGTVGLLFTVLSYNAPIGVMAGLMPAMIVAGTGQKTPLMYLAVLVFMLLFAVGIVSMARHMAKPGAFYTYITHALGRVVGLGAGLLALTGYIVLGAATYIYLGIVANLVSTSILHGPDLPWWVWAAIAWAVASGLSLFNVDVSTKVLGVLLTIEVLIVLIWDARVLINGGDRKSVV